MLDFSFLRIGISTLLSIALWPVAFVGYWMLYLARGPRFTEVIFATFMYHIVTLIVWSVAALVICFKLGIQPP